MLYNDHLFQCAKRGTLDDLKKCISERQQIIQKGGKINLEHVSKISPLEAKVLQTSLSMPNSKQGDRRRMINDQIKNQTILG